MPLTRPFHPRAFTLVELMIVVSILGILAAVVVAKVQGQTDQAILTVAQTFEQDLQKASQRYLAETGDPAATFGTFVSESKADADELSISIPGAMRRQLNDPDADLVDANELVLDFRNGLRVEFTYDPSDGMIAATYTGTGAE